MKKIELTQGQVAIVDDDLYEELNRFKWHVARMGKLFYATRKLPTINGKQPMLYMHHEIIGKPQKGYVTDHISGIGTDNQRCNLRHVTQRQNCQNIKNIRTTSKYPGVTWHKEVDKWQAQIKINGKLKFLFLYMALVIL